MTLALPHLTALAAAAAGTALFVALGMPLPVLLGPMFGCLGAALAGLPLRSPAGVTTVMRTVLGVAIGTSVTWALVAALPGWWPTLALIPVLVGLIGLVCYPFLRRACRYDRATAFYGAMPGGLQDMLAFGEEAGGNPRTLSLLHATRVLMIVTLAPLALTWLYGLDLTRAPGAPASSIPAWEIAAMLAAGIAGWKLAAAAGLFGASILGPMLLTAALSLAGVIEHRPPAELIWAAQFFLGLAVGAKYAGITARELVRDVGAGAALSVLMALVSLAVLAAALALSPAGQLELWLSFLPGGQAEMVIVALVAGGDVAFVVTHHLLRVLLVILVAPLVARRLP
jgi:membrane AbrB-like protein